MIENVIYIYDDMTKTGEEQKESNIIKINM